MQISPFLSVKTCVLGAQKNRPNVTVLLSTHNISFSREIRKVIFNYALLSGGLGPILDPCTVVTSKRKCPAWFSLLLLVNPEIYTEIYFLISQPKHKL